MGFKSFVQLFVPPIYYKVKRALKPRRLVNANPLPMHEKVGKRLIVVGNGPSLNKTMNLYADEICNTECMMVNYSASYPLYEVIRPSVYVLTDRGWYTDPRTSVSVNKLINSLKDKTTWNLTLVLPGYFNDWWALEELRKNKNITIWKIQRRKG